MRPNIKCDIIIPVWNELKLTQKCIETIKQNTATPYRILVIDNGSDVETTRYLTRLSEEGEMTLIRNKENLGFPKAVNQGITYSDSPYVCVLNNDTEVCKGWLHEMIKIAEKDATIGIVNPSSNNLGQKKPETGLDGKWIEMAVCIGFCMLIKREVIEKIGNFDEIYSPGNFEDTDFSKRAIKAGYRCVMAKGSYVYHKENTSFKKRKDWEERFRRNEKIFNERWGRPRRVAYIIMSSGGNNFEAIKGGIEEFLKRGDWIWIFLKKGSRKFDIRGHVSLRIFELGKGAFSIRVLWRILKRKKRFDEVVTDSKKLTELFRLFGYSVRNI